MGRINQLTQKPTLSDDDIIPVWDSESSRTRAVLASTILKYIDDHPTTDKFVQSGVYSNGNLTLTYNDGLSFVIPGFDIGGANGYEDGGSIGVSSDPKTLDTGVYYVTEKFVDAPVLDGSYVGSLIVQDDIDGDDNGKILTYYTDNGAYYRQKFTGGWEDWKKAGKVELSGFYLNWSWTKQTAKPEVGDPITLSVNRPVPPDASLGGMVYGVSSSPDGIATISGNIITTTGVGTVYPTATAPNGTKNEGGIDIVAVGQGNTGAPPPTPDDPVGGGDASPFFNYSKLQKTKLDDINFITNSATKTITAELIADNFATKTKQIDLLPWFTSAFAPTLSLHFSGIYNELADLTDAIKTPTENMQAIVIKPSEKYYHGVGGAWVELAPVGAFHSNYLGAYDSLNDLNAAEPSPADDSLAIVGTTAKSFYIYDGTKWEQLTHTDLPSLDARVTSEEAKTASNIQRLNAAEGHLQTLQTGQAALQNNIDQKISGIHLEDTEGNAFDDINGIVFEGAEVQDDQGSKTSHVVIKPKITIANGQQPGSTSATGNAIIFEGSQVSVDPNDSNVIKVGVHASSHDGIIVGDGVNESREVQNLIFNGHQAFGSGDTAEIHLEFAHFKTIAERDTWTVKFKDHMDYDLIALVDADENGFVAYYRFDAATKSWKDYDAQGVVMSDSNGAIPKNIKTVVFGQGFSIKQAGDQEDAALISYTGSTGGGGSGGINVDMVGGQSNAGVQTLKIYPPMEAYDDPDEANTVRILVDPSAYEPLHKPSFLAYLAETEEIVGKIDAAYGDKSHHDGALWFGDIICPAGTYIQADKVNKAYGIQEADDLDPNVTGGTDYLVILRIAMKGKAPDDGVVRAYLYNKSVDPFSQTGYLKDVNDQIMGYQRSYVAGEELGVIEVVGVVNAKGLQSFTAHVMDDFASDQLNLEDRTEGGTCLMIQAITSEGKTGDGLQQFEIDTQQNIEFSSHYLGVDRASLNWLVQKDMPITIGNSSEAQTMIDGYHFYNINPMKFGVQSGHVHFEDNGTSVCDFNFGRIFSAEETQMLRGKTIHVTTTLVDKDNGFEVALVSWTGKPDEYTPEIYKSRNNGIPVFDTGWAKGDSYFISEDAVSGDHTVSKVFTVPSDANNYAVIIYPVQAQQPITLKLKQLQVDVSPAFIGYALKAPGLVGEAHLYESQEKIGFVQDNQGYASLRYTIVNKPTPMPVGIPVAGMGQADITIDPSINIINGSAAKGGEGALVFNSDGKVSMTSVYRVFAGESVPVGQKRNVRFWWSTYNPDDKSFTEIPSAEIEVEVTGGDKVPMYVAIPNFDFSVEAGDMIGAFAQSDIADGAFIECSDGRSPIVRTTINFKELKAGGADTADLISAPLSKSLVQDFRYYEFSGNSAQNIEIADLSIPADVRLASVVVDIDTPTGFRSEQAEHAYNKSTQVLTVHVGGAASGTVYMTFWSKG